MSAARPESSAAGTGSFISDTTVPCMTSLLLLVLVLPLLSLVIVLILLLLVGQQLGCVASPCFTAVDSVLQ